ncbi:hypothetical protein DV735_g2825, partial [Chaetothyriales sp. CBS 134920]
MAWGLPGWLTGSSSPSATSSAPKSKDGGYIAPDRNAREQCYESRDLFFRCLDKHDILDAISEDDKARRLCSEEVAVYERDCAKTWIKYFKEKRIQDYKRDLAIKQIQEEDAKSLADHKARQKARGWLS